MGLKTFFHDMFGIETKEEKQARESLPKEQQPTSDEEKEAKEMQWADVNDPQKFVIMGAKVQCTFCAPPIGDLIVTENDVMLQDKPWATVADKDGVKNFNFTGVCTHPSQQKPATPPPPCKAVINLGEWRNYSETKVNTDNALLMQSTIPCMSGAGNEITIVDCGQRTTLASVKPKTEVAEEKIVSVEILEGDEVARVVRGIETERVTRTGITSDYVVTQFVNITQNQEHISKNRELHIDRLGRKIRLKVKFNKEGKFPFFIRLTPDNFNARYSPEEKSRNPSFKPTEEEVRFMTDSNGEKIIEAEKIIVTPAGGDIFTISAIDEEGNEMIATGQNSKKEKIEAKIRTRRLMYYVEMEMTGLANTANGLTVFRNEFNRHRIIFQDLPKVIMLAAHSAGVIDPNRNNELTTFRNNVNTVFDESEERKNKRPYCVAVVYADHLALRNEGRDVEEGNVQGGSSTPVNITIQDNNQRRYALWHNLGCTNSGWFVACRFEYATNGVSNPPIDIPVGKCTPRQAQNRPRQQGYCDSVDIDVSGLPNVQGTIVLTVNWVSSWLGGFAIRGTNITAVATRSRWSPNSIQQQNEIIIHEVGHQLGMVPFTGRTFYNANNIAVPNIVDNTNLAPPTYQYTGRGHAGSHCHSGIALRTNFRVGSNAGTNCVMFGATNERSSFCANGCADAVRKVDLSNGVKI